MTTVNQLSNFADSRGNAIVCDGEVTANIRINFKGFNNTLVVSKTSRIRQLTVHFDCDNGLVRIGDHIGPQTLSASIRVGQDSQVIMGSNVTSTAVCYMSATEGTEIRIGDDVMIASGNQIRADDAHPIFDVRTGKRVNPSRSINVGNHVWLAREAVVLAGASIGDGSVIGYGSIVTKSIPNNCIASGVPARVKRKHIAWERPHLSGATPYYKPDASTVEKSVYWNLTEEDEIPANRRGSTAKVVSTGLGRARAIVKRAYSAASRLLVP